MRKNYKRTMIKKYGSLEAWIDHLAKIGSKGGKRTKGYEFAHGKTSPSEAGKKGGKISKRPSKKVINAKEAI